MLNQYTLYYHTNHSDNFCQITIDNTHRNHENSLTYYITIEDIYKYLVFTVFKYIYMRKLD